MAVHLAFNEIERFDTVSDPSAVLNTTFADIVESGVNRAGFRINKRASAEVNLPTPLSSGWFHCRIKTKTGTTVGQLIASLINLNRGGDLLDSLVAIRSPGGNGSEATLLAVRLFADADTDTKITWDSFVGDIDINFVIAEQGLVRVYLDGVAVYEFLGDTRFESGDQAIDTVTFAGTGTTSSTSDAYATFYSQVIVADEPTINAKVYTLELSEGSTMDWDGTVADVVGMNPADPGDELTSDAADEVALFSCTMPAIDEGANRIAEAFFNSTVFSEPEAAPINIDFVYYDGESTTEADELKPITVIPSTLTWRLSPHVGPLSVAVLDALEFGVITKEA